MENHGRRAIVIGATGLVGGMIVQQLLEQPEYDRVRVLARRPMELEHSKLEQHIVDWNRLDAAEHLFKDADDLYCALGTTIKKAGNRENFRLVDLEYPVEAARLAVKQGVAQMLVVSSMGADAGSRIFYSRTKGEMEDALAKAGFRALHMFRPSLILGDRQEKRAGEQLAAHVMQFLDGWMKKGKAAQYRAIQATTIAAAMINTAMAQSTGNHVYSNHVIQVLGRENS